MRIVFSVLVVLLICAAGVAGIYYNRPARSTADTATPKTVQTDPTEQTGRTTVADPAGSQAEQKTDSTPAIEQPVNSPPSPAPLPPRIVKTEPVAPLPDDAAGARAQHGDRAAHARIKKAKKDKKSVVRPKKRPLKTAPPSPTR